MRHWLAERRDSVLQRCLLGGKVARPRAVPALLGQRIAGVQCCAVQAPGVLRVGHVGVDAMHHQMNAFAQKHGLVGIGALPMLQIRHRMQGPHHLAWVAVTAQSLEQRVERAGCGAWHGHEVLRWCSTWSISGRSVRRIARMSTEAARGVDIGMLHLLSNQALFAGLGGVVWQDPHGRHLGKKRHVHLGIEQLQILQLTGPTRAD